MADDKKIGAEASPPAEIKAADEASPVTTISYVQRAFRMYPVTEQELDRLLSGFTSPCTIFFGIVFGGAVTVSVTYLSVSEEGLRIYLFAGMIPLWILSLFLGAMAIKDWLSARKQVSDIKSKPLQNP